MTTIDWVVLVAATAAIGWVNWYFFMPHVKWTASGCRSRNVREDRT